MKKESPQRLRIMRAMTCHVVLLGRDLFQIQVSNEKNLDWLDYIGDYTTQLCRDYFINHEIRIPIIYPGP